MSNNETIVNIGLELTDACFNTYGGTASEIGPDSFGYVSAEGNYTGEDQTPEQLEFYAQHGFYPMSCEFPPVCLRASSSWHV